MEEGSQSEHASHKEVTKVYEHVEIELNGQMVGFNFCHVGLDENNKDKKIEINKETLQNLAKEFDILSKNPEITDGKTNIFLDYRSLPRKVFDTVTKKFGSEAPSFFSKTLGAAETHPENDKDQNRYIYISKPSRIALFFHPRRMEEKFRHELKHLTHTIPNLDVNTELKMRLTAWAGTYAGAITASAGVANAINTNQVTVENTALAFAGGLMVAGAYKLYSKAPSEQEAIQSEKYLSEQNVFIIPEGAN